MEYRTGVCKGCPLLTKCPPAHVQQDPLRLALPPALCRFLMPLPPPPAPGAWLSSPTSSKSFWASGYNRMGCCHADPCDYAAMYANLPLQLLCALWSESCLSHAPCCSGIRSTLLCSPSPRSMPHRAADLHQPGLAAAAPAAHGGASGQRADAHTLWAALVLQEQGARGRTRELGLQCPGAKSSPGLRWQAHGVARLLCQA